MLKIYRFSAWADKAWKYKIVLDGNTLGKISDGESLEFSIGSKQTLSLFFRQSYIWGEKEFKNWWLVKMCYNLKYLLLLSTLNGNQGVAYGWLWSFQIKNEKR